MACMQELQEAIFRYKREMSLRAGRRRGLVKTMRGTARNELLRRLASHSEQPVFSDLVWLEDIVAKCKDPKEKLAWQTLLARYEVSTSFRSTHTVVPACIYTYIYSYIYI
jgi:hypothetical protein